MARKDRAPTPPRRVQAPQQRRTPPSPRRRPPSEADRLRPGLVRAGGARRRPPGRVPRRRTRSRRRCPRDARSRGLHAADRARGRERERPLGRADARDRGGLEHGPAVERPALPADGHLRRVRRAAPATARRAQPRARRRLIQWGPRVPDGEVEALRSWYDGRPTRMVSCWRPTSRSAIRSGSPPGGSSTRTPAAKGRGHRREVPDLRPGSRRGVPRRLRVPGPGGVSARRITAGRQLTSSRRGGGSGRRSRLKTGGPRGVRVRVPPPASSFDRQTRQLDWRRGRHRGSGGTRPPRVGHAPLSHSASRSSTRRCRTRRSRRHRRAAPLPRALDHRQRAGPARRRPAHRLPRLPRPALERHGPDEGRHALRPGGDARRVRRARGLDDVEVLAPAAALRRRQGRRALHAARRCRPQSWSA